MKFRYLLTFSKTKALRFIGHLDIQKLFELAFRRSQLPMAFSEGFHPHMLFSIANPLPLGVESQCELLEIYLTQSLPLEQIQAQLNTALPQDIRIIEVGYLPSQTKPVMAQVQTVSYQFEFPESSPAQVQSQNYLQSSYWPVKREGKSGLKEFDLKSRILKFEWLNSVTAHMECQADANGGVKLSEMLSVFGDLKTHPKIVRTGIKVLS